MVLQLKLSHTIGSTSTTTNCSVPFILVSAGILDRLSEENRFLELSRN